MTESRADVLIIGGGMAGASAAAELSETHRVVVLERESMPGYHSTGRSAALFSETYGNFAVRALTRASKQFLFDPPQGFAQSALVKRRGSMYIARPDQISSLHALVSSGDVSNAVDTIDAAQAIALCPILRPSYVAAAVIEPNASDVDVHALHHGYLRVLRRNQGAVVTNAEVLALEERGGEWRAHTRGGVFAAPIVINAAGAWADEIGAAAGAAVCNIEPRRRTAILVDAPAGISLTDWPLTIDIDEGFYFKPDAGLLLVSPADETTVEPCDVQPEELDIALAIDRVERASTLTFKHIRKRWAGLRSFAPDRTPVIGFDAQRPGFFWLAAQGGYGIQTAPAVAKLAAALVRDEALPGELKDFDPACVSPVRFRRSLEETPQRVFQGRA